LAQPPAEKTAGLIEEKTDERRTFERWPKKLAIKLLNC
jgi:hypothetical protein